MAQYIKLILLTYITLTAAFTAPSNFRSSDSQLNVGKLYQTGKVPAGEEGRLYRRTVYTPDDWVKHRDPDRFFRNLSSTLDSAVAKQIIKEVSVVTIIAICTVLWNTLVVDGYIDFDSVHHEPLFHVPKYLLFSLPMGLFQQSSSIIGLMLVFRFNTSYSRWNEGRSLWGKIVNHTRNIMRMGSSWTLTESYEENPIMLNKALHDLEIAIWEFPRSLQRHLLRADEDEETFQKDVREKLDPEAAEALIASPHRPTKALFDLSQAVNELPISYLKRIEIDKSITVLIDCAGACERILSAPIPLVYTRHTARILSLWLVLLPFSLWGPFEGTWNHLGMVPAAAILSFFFFGIEELAVQLEEPFSILPLTAITNGSIFARVQEFGKYHLVSQVEKTMAPEPFGPEKIMMEQAVEAESMMMQEAFYPERFNVYRSNKAEPIQFSYQAQNMQLNNPDEAESNQISYQAQNTQLNMGSSHLNNGNGAESINEQAAREIGNGITFRREELERIQDAWRLPK